MKSVIILPAIILWGLFVHAFVAEGEASLDRQSTKRSGIISGNIIVEGGRPAIDSQIQAIPVGGRLDENHQTSCDSDGNFKFTGLRSGAYLIRASLPGYVPLRRTSEPEVYRVGDVVTINMVKGGVITGRVTDAYGEPMVKVRVTPQLVRDPEGRRIPSFPVNRSGSDFGSITDDRGVYRIYGLEPGTYLLSVTGDVPNEFFGPENRSRETATFYPSTNRETASEVTVRSGEEVIGIDIRHRGERGRVLSGIITGALESDALINFVVITLRNPVQGNIEAMTAVFGSAKFTIAGIPDGEYLISGHRGTENNQQSASVPRRLSVRGADISGIEIRLLALGSIAGRVVIEYGGGVDNCVKEEPRNPEEVTLNAQLSEKGRRAASLPLGAFDLPEGSDGSVPDEKGEFVIKDLESGRHRIVTDLPGENLFLRSITQTSPAPGKRVGGTTVDLGRDGVLLRQGEKLNNVKITIASGAASLSGRVVSSGGDQPKTAERSAGRLRVHLVPAEVTSAGDVLRYYETIARNNGAFEFKHLTPGKYLLLARPVPDTEPMEPNSPQTAWDLIERQKLRREAESSKKEIELQPCMNVKDYVLRD
ncbi:MAG: carboxypeptidase-like regulatory domain-containing protein [Acidobacteria bacterium]|nr:carboxypeptidase-like regulatory domain-containing protein [Acidobacteriota bacterium]